jgi:two-component system response regulator NreC
MRSGLRAIVEAAADMAVVGESNNISDAQGLIDKLKPGVIVTDLSISNVAELDAMRTIKNGPSGAKILVLAYQTCEEYFSLAMRAGADGYLTREAQPEEVVNAIRSVSRGQNYVNPTIITLMVGTYIRGTRTAALKDPYDELSEREKEIMCLAATGHTNKEIAEVLHLSKQTVHNLRARLMDKLGFHDRLELLKYAIRRGCISAEET